MYKTNYWLICIIILLFTTIGCVDNTTHGITVITTIGNNSTSGHTFNPTPEINASNSPFGKGHFPNDDDVQCTYTSDGVVDFVGVDSYHINTFSKDANSSRINGMPIRSYVLPKVGDRVRVTVELHATPEIGHPDILDGFFLEINRTFI